MTGPFHPRSPRAGALGCLVAVSILSGCAARPGPQVLEPIPASVEGARTVTVHVATTREREAPDGSQFTSRRAAATNYATYDISIPPVHRPGAIEWPDAEPSAATSFVTIRRAMLDRPAFEQGVAGAADRRRPRRIGVFVHGFNTSFQEALYRLAQMAADADLGGVPVLFAWPSVARVTGYLEDKEAATYSRDALAALLAGLARDGMAEEVVLVAHSMGGWLAVEALRQLRLTGRDDLLARLSVVLAAPDIDVDVFRAQMQVIGRLPTPLVLLVSSDDRALGVSSFLTGDRQRLGAIGIVARAVQDAAVKANVQVIDISSLEASDRMNHDRYLSLVALYPRLAAAGDGKAGGLRRAGAFVFNAVGAALSSPFELAGRAIAGD
ncbi:alpha/beta hydrolase [Stella sp.]|uniref:alpha/beta hydrolase n=1 Tax=Stella sp. TaxID=2912054 RepID=UPI0035B4BAF7